LPFISILSASRGNYFAGRRTLGSTLKTHKSVKNPRYCSVFRNGGGVTPALSALARQGKACWILKDVDASPAMSYSTLWIKQPLI
jgi:hypothetical protein